MNICLIAIFFVIFFAPSIETNPVINQDQTEIIKLVVPILAKLGIEGLSKEQVEIFAQKLFSNYLGPYKFYIIGTVGLAAVLTIYATSYEFPLKEEFVAHLNSIIKTLKEIVDQLIEMQSQYYPDSQKVEKYRKIGIDVKRLYEKTACLMTSYKVKLKNLGYSEWFCSSKWEFCTTTINFLLDKLGLVKDNLKETQKRFEYLCVVLGPEMKAEQALKNLIDNHEIEMAEKCMERIKTVIIEMCKEYGLKEVKYDF